MVWDALARVARLLPPEVAHQAALAALSRGLGPRVDPARHPGLALTLFGLPAPNPIGLAAGFDKDAAAVMGAFRLGFALVEIGTVTPRPQPGNPRPRVFRDRAAGAVVNRMGFPGAGAAHVRRRLERLPAKGQRPGLLGVNLGRNKDSAPDGLEDYAAGARLFAPFADYLCVNVSSPNTPGLRDLQRREPLQRLLETVLAARGGDDVPVLVKVAPDLDEAGLDAVAAACLSAGVAGVIATNTTTSRPPGLPPRLAAEAGGLSGRPLAPLALATLRGFAARLEGRLVLGAAGGIATAGDVAARLAAGASFVQLYTALALEGPGLIARLLDELAAARAT